MCTALLVPGPFVPMASHTSFANAHAQKEAPWFDTRTLKVAPKYVLPLEKQGPWESRKLWSKVTAALRKRPNVDWAVVDREKSVLEEAQRELACHSKEGGVWSTKYFHERKSYDAVEGTTKEMYTFDYLNTKPYNADEPPCNLLWLSQTYRDDRTPGDTTGATPAAAATAGAGAASGEAGSGAGAAAAAGTASGEGEAAAAAAAAK